VILWYGKGHSDRQLKFRLLFSSPEQETIDNKYPYLDGEKHFGLRDSSSQGETDSGRYQFEFQGKVFQPPSGRHWSTTENGMQRLSKANYLFDFGRQLRVKRYEYDFPVSPLNNLWTDTQRGSFQESKIYVVQTNTEVIQRCILMATDPGDLVLDPTCGGGTTAFVAEQWGRRWITIDTSRVALALTRTRLMGARFPYFLLADSPQGQQKEAEITGTVPPSGERPDSDVRKGFVYERAPHVTLKSIANNGEIDAIHARWKGEMDPIRKDLSKSVKRSWEEWEIPQEASDEWPDEAKVLHAEWWRMCRSRQAEIEGCIAQHAETELLYDKPFVDNKRVRVAGPFTVESLSPHRVLSTDLERPTSLGEGERLSAGQFERMIVENLKVSGVQNTFKNERLKFDLLEPYAGTWLHATGEYTEAGKVKRVAVCIGPEHGTVGPDLVKDAAKEAVHGIGFDLLIVCGFAFDPHVSEEGKHYGKLQVLTARMNPDLAMGQELLKKTGSGNLFMVFGEPDVEVKQKDGKVVVKINGLDVYDPTTGEVRSSSTEDIACWFIDTDYNEESFFVRHAYFTGGGDPYEKLKRALKADIDEAAWSALYSTKSRPFEVPSTGKIAVKVINHYGDEVLRVYEVQATARVTD
jgi:adenine-specific DNA-methyltransferase